MKIISIILATSISFATLAVLDTIESQIKEYASLDDFLTDLKATAGNMIDYVTKIQALFCPDQPVCGAVGEREREDVFGELPSAMTIGNLTIKPENIHNVVGICCLPCSCSDTCWQDDNCCPVKQLIRNKTNTDPARKRCIAASIMSYDVTPRLSSYHADFMYLMTTDCLQNTTNLTLLETCRNPDIDSYDNVIPVTSKGSGYTYWNRACAVCNYDYEDIMEWTPHVLFKRDIAYFSDTSRSLSAVKLPETFEETFVMLRNYRLADIIYEAPVPVDHSMCLMTESVPMEYCEMSPTEIALNATDWAQESCRQLHSLITDHMGPSGSRRPYRNIFCFICLQNIQLTEQKPACKRGQFGKLGARYITALLSYKTSQDNSDATNTGRPLVKNICGCNEIFDPYLKLCRPSYCPAGKFPAGCTCIQALQNLSGMPILFQVNVSVKLGQTEPFSESQLKKMKNAFSQTLRETVQHISVEIALIFQQANASNPNYIFTVILYSEPGYDTKLTMIPFATYLDAEEAFEVKTTDIFFLARLTSAVYLWKELTGYHAQSVKRPATKFIQVYIDDFHMESSLLKPGNCQKFSRLLYCTQLQLNESEYFETTPGMITINVTDSTFTVTDFYKISSSEVRVCADEYLKMTKETSGEAVRRYTLGMLGLLMVLVLIILDI